MTDRSELTAEIEQQFAAQFDNISADEMRCKCGECLLPIDDAEFVSFCVALQNLRNVLAFPFTFTSLYRCPTYNDSLYHGQKHHLSGPHTKGAADMLTSFERMYQLVAGAADRGMGIGIKQHGNVNNRYIHIDNLGSRLWTYT